MVTEARLAENCFELNYLQKKSLIILDISDRPNMIVQLNALYVIYSVIIIYIFDVKAVYAIYLRIYTSRHYGIIFQNSCMLHIFFLDIFRQIFCRWNMFDDICSFKKLSRSHNRLLSGKLISN